MLSTVLTWCLHRSGGIKSAGDASGRPDGRRSDRALYAAFAAGLLAVVYEHGAKHPWIAPLVAATAQRRAPTEIVAHVPMELALLDAVLAAPQDDAPRLVLADWLAERDDPRGELIQIQCTLGRTLTGAAFQPSKPVHRPESIENLKARETKLLAQFGADWGRAEAPVMTRRAWHRGFVEGGFADVAAFVDAHPVLARTPLDWAKLEGLDASSMLKLAGAAAHPTLFGLDLAQNRIDRHRASIFGSELIAGVRALGLYGNREMGDVRAITALAKGARRVERLDLTRCGLTDGAVACLAETDVFRRLTHLALHDDGLTGASLVHLSRAASLTHLWAHGAVLATAERAMALIEHAPPSLQTLHAAKNLDPRTRLTLSRRFDVRDGHDDLPLRRSG